MVTRPGLAIRLKRHADAAASITLTRADGTVTWQRQSGNLALVFPSHDLTHYAVEQALGYLSGFYGLVADGWDILDFATPWPRGPIPAAKGRYAHSLVPRRLNDEDVVRVRARRVALLEQWAETARGAALELTFTRW